VNLEPFYVPPECAKCGGGDISTKYCCGDHDKTPSLIFGGDDGAEHLHRQCDRCGFMWLEKCKDAPEAWSRGK
jgi:hypothetical protein